MDSGRDRRYTLVVRGVKIYVEGGGGSKHLRSLCRRGFSEFFRKAGCSGRMPAVVACGSRQNAYDSFCTAVSKGESALLLVDSEAPVEATCQLGSPSSWMPWQHLASSKEDGWPCPINASDSHCHLMVQCMEAWFLADPETIAAFFGQGFQKSHLPHVTKPVEGIAKSVIFDVLKRSTRACKTKRPYGKGEHSFKILAMLDPVRVMSASPWAKRLIDALART